MLLSLFLFLFLLSLFVVSFGVVVFFHNSHIGDGSASDVACHGKHSIDANHCHF